MKTRSLMLALLACGGPAANTSVGPASHGHSSHGHSSDSHASRSHAATSNPSGSTATPPRLSLSTSGGCWLRDGRVWCWNGAPAELAATERSNSAAPSTALRAILLPAGAIDVAGSLGFGCSVLASGAVHCWGDNTYGQLGAATSAASSAQPVATRGIDSASSVAVASDHACATLKDGSVACWGNNTYGQCGHDREYAPAVRQLVLPERVEGVRGARRVVASSGSSCALADEVTWCWGALLGVNDGSGPGTDRTRATPIAPLARAKALALGSECGCALTAESRVACFALTPHGCPSADVRAGLEPLFGWSDVRALAVGDRGACAERPAGVACWSHLARDPSAGAPVVPLAHTLPVSSPGVPVVADGPCVLGGGQLACWGSEYWNESKAGTGGPARPVPGPLWIVLP